MENFIKFLVTPLLSQPDKFTLTSTDSSISLKVDPEDMGRIIGKHGIVINSLRNLVRTYCALHSLPPINLTLQES